MFPVGCDPDAGKRDDFSETTSTSLLGARTKIKTHVRARQIETVARMKSYFNRRKYFSKRLGMALKFGCESATREE
jgi:hypothetical protein